MKTLLTVGSVAALLAINSLSVNANASEQIKVRTELAHSVLVSGERQKAYLSITLEGLPFEKTEYRTPVNVALVIDKSGSMRGQKLRQAKEAAIMALNRLAYEDILSVVAYNHNVDVIVPATRLKHHNPMADLIRNFRADGRTALYAGVEQGIRQIKNNLSSDRVNRVILLSDGLANVGPSQPHQLAELGRRAASHGISVTTIGLGLGFNEDLMTKLAYSSDGNHAFVEYPEDLVKIFNQEFGDVLSVVAQQIEITIVFKNGFRPIRSLGRSSVVNGNRVTLKLNQLYGKQEKRALLEFEADGSHQLGENDIASIDVKYFDLASKGDESSHGSVRAEFSSSKQQAQKSINKKVMTSVSRQIAIEENERAVTLRDQGQLDEAKKILEKNAVFLKERAEKLGSKALEEMYKENLDDASAITSSQWNKQRKVMRARQYKGKTQQSY